MKKIVAKAQTYLSDKSGATAIEYGLIAAGVILAIVALLFVFGEDLGLTGSDEVSSLPPGDGSKELTQ